MIESLNNNLPFLSDVDPDDNFINLVYPGLAARSSLYYSTNNFKNAIGDDDFIILNLNIRSFDKNFDLFIAFISSADVNPDIIVLSETWLSEPVNIEGYKSFHSFRCGRRSGGVSVFVRESLSCHKLNEFSVVNDTIESCVVKISLVSLNFFIFAVYRPHSDNICNFTNALQTVLTNSCLKHDVCLLGDLNINLLDVHNSDVVCFSAMMRTFNFVPVITKPTRFPSSTLNQSASLLDHIWLNFTSDYSNCSGIILDNITDHCTTFLTLSKTDLLVDNSHDMIEVRFRLENEGNIEKFKVAISSINWDILTGFADINIATSYFIKTVNDIYCKCFPLMLKKISRKRNCKPWLTPEILKHVKYKSIRFKKCKLGLMSEADNRRVRNFVNGVVRKAKVKYLKSRFQGSMGDMRKTWNHIRKLVSFGDGKHTIDEINVNDSVISNHGDIARCFNDYFCSVASTIDNSLPVSDLNPLSYIDYNAHSLFFDPVTINEIISTVMSLKNTKSKLNSISVKILKLCSPFLSYPLSLIINKSLHFGVFPDILKDACVVPIFKKGDKSDMKNYRPISILPLFSKVIEKCVARRLESFMSRFSVMCSNQYGFRKGLSTIDAIVNYSEYICRNLEEHNHVIGVFIDYSKAFDTVNHRILLSKLEAYGVRGVTLNWLRSYLDGRRQCVRVGNSYSDYKSVSIGVPQGSVLGPLLFTLYVNDFANISRNLKTVLFADDTTVSAAGPNFGELCFVLNTELEAVNSWSISNRLSLNTEKTGAVLFSNRFHDVDPEIMIFMNGVELTFLEV